MTTPDNTPAQGAAPATHSEPTYFALRRNDRPEFVAPDLRKAVVYARFSTTGQKEVSIDRQCELAGEYIEATGRVLADTYVDRARSGASMAGRDELERLLVDATTGAFGIVVVENVDRLARDLGILSTVYKRLLGLGIEMHQPGRGRLSLTDIAVQGLMGDENRRILSERTQFSRDVMAREGRFPTGPCYGYAKVPGRPGEPVVDEAQAEVVRRIFGMRAAGLSPKMITIALNRAGTLTGKLCHWSERHVRDIMTNPRYMGVLVYNRYRSGKHPKTGKRQYLLRPRKDWIVTEVPDARIVDQKLWEQVQQITEGRRADPGRRPKTHARDYLLSGLASCPSCGGRMRIQRFMHRPPKFQCASYALRRTCDDKTMSSVIDVERLVVGLVSDELADPAFTQAYIDGYNEESARKDIEHVGVPAELERRVATLDRKLTASFEEALTRGFTNARLAEWRTRIERDLSDAERDLHRTPRHPKPIGIDRERLGSLRQSMASLSASAPFEASDEAGMMLMADFRNLVEKVVVTRVGMEVSVAVMLRVGILVEASGGRDATAGIGTRVVNGMYRMHLTERDAYKFSEARRIADRRAADGVYALDDREWSMILKVFPRNAVDPVKRRMAVDAMVFRQMTGASWNCLPASFGNIINIRILFYVWKGRGLWDRIVAALVEHDPRRWQGLATPLTPTSYKDLCAREPTNP